jgi:hypothetical protein
MADLAKELNGLWAGGFRDAEVVAWCQIAFAAEPVFHAGLQAVERYAIANFEQAIADGQCVIEDSVICEVTHGEAVDPFDGAGVGLTCSIDAVDSEVAGKHDQAKSANRGESIGAV